MPRVFSDRAIHYREQAEQFHRLAKMEIQPRARARLLELADEYQELAAQNRENQAVARLTREHGTSRRTRPLREYDKAVRQGRELPVAGD
jgi:hypothetical protein